MRFSLSLCQLRPRSGAFHENADRLIAAVERAHQKVRASADNDAKHVVFAGRGTIEGPQGWGAFIHSWVNDSLADAVLKIHEAMMAAGVILYVPVFEQGHLLPMRLGDGSSPLVLDPEAGSVLIPGSDSIQMGMRPGSGALVYWPGHICRESYAEFPVEALEKPQAGCMTVVTTVGGAEGEHAYAGESFVAFGSKVFKAAAFEEDVLTLRCEADEGLLSLSENEGAPPKAKIESVEPLGAFENKLFAHPADPAERHLLAIMSALKHYLSDAHAEGYVLGISGGIDSALVASLAVEAVGAERVKGIMLSSRFTSKESRILAKKLAEALGLESYAERSIEPLHATVESDFEVDLGKLPEGDLTDQNIQARLRALRLMAIANKENRILLCTANKSEAALGYGTLYGDLAGGFAPISDLWKSEVEAVCRAFNRMKGGEVIPEAIITREPTAELRPGQKDSDSLPPYAEIERVMRQAIDPAFDPRTLGNRERRIFQEALVFTFKRRQCPSGLILSPQPLSLLDERWGLNRKIDWPRGR